MAGEIKTSLIGALKQLGISFRILTLKMPILVLVSLAGVFFIIERVSSHPAVSVGVLGALLVILCLIIYVKTKAFADTALAFILGVFTVFSISWDDEKVILFGALFCTFVLFVFIISSVRIAAQKESILIQAASFHNVSNHKSILKSLTEFSDLDRGNSQLGPIERAECLRIFCFRKVQLDTMSRLLELTNMVYTITEISHEECAEFVCAIHELVSARSFEKVEYRDSTYLIGVLLDLPFRPSETMALVRSSKQVVTSGVRSLKDYVEIIQNKSQIGWTSDEIVKQLRRGAT